MWLLATAAAVALLANLVTYPHAPQNAPQPVASPACLAGLDTLEALTATPSGALLGEVETACGK
jgi:hypothetical protein